MTSVVHLSNSVISNNHNIALDIRDKGALRLNGNQITGNNIAVQVAGTGAIASMQNNMHRQHDRRMGPSAITPY